MKKTHSKENAESAAERQLLSLAEQIASQYSSWIGKPEKGSDSSLIDYFLQCPLPEKSPYELHVDFTFARAFVWLVVKGFSHEVSIFLEHYFRTEGTVEKLFLSHYKEKELDPTRYKWQSSLITLANYTRSGEAGVLDSLPHLFLEDFTFFISQRWIQSLLRSWYQKGEEEKFHHAFFGTVKGKVSGKGRGKRRLQTLREVYFRNRRLREEVRQLCPDGKGVNQAIKRVCADHKRLKLPVSESTVRAAYYEDPLGNPFTDLFSFSN